MSELMNTSGRRSNLLQRLLTTASAFSLLTMLTLQAKAEDADRPTVWVELGGQLEHLSRYEDGFAPAFITSVQDPGPTPFTPQGLAKLFPGTPVTLPDVPFDPLQPRQAQKLPEYSVGGEGKISFAPHGSDWLFTISLRYGRANGSRDLAQQTDARESYVAIPGPPEIVHTPDIQRFTNAQTKYAESHAVLDFQAGKDVGLGLLGHDGKSTLSAGVRLVQFESQSSATFNANPSLQAEMHHLYFPPFFDSFFENTRFQTYAFTGHVERSFRGIGPTLSWNASASLVGDTRNAEFTLDAGLNAALLFGRQKVRGAHQTSSYDRYHTVNFIYDNRVTRYKTRQPITRSHSVTVPNLGGFAGVSLKFPNAKVSLGYRADFFFGAVDTGIDARHTQDMAFHGPFATISVGLGD